MFRIRVLTFCFFAVLKQWLNWFQLCFVIIFAVLLQKIIRKCRSFFQDDGRTLSCICGTQFWTTYEKHFDVYITVQIFVENTAVA